MSKTFVLVSLNPYDNNVGPFQTLEDAESERERLLEKGYHLDHCFDPVEIISSAEFETAAADELDEDNGDSDSYDEPVSSTGS